MKLIIARYGQTEENIKRITHGHTPGKLTKLGIEQSKKLGKRLSKEKIDFIYCSDLARAKDTAKEIIKYHTGIPVEYTKTLRERGMGKFEGKSKDSAEGFKSAYNYDEDIQRSNNVETYKDLFKRAKHFLDNSIKKHKKQTVLIIAHGTINRAFICAIMNKNYEYMHNIGVQYNAAISIFEIDDKRSHKIHFINSTKHLGLVSYLRHVLHYFS